MKFYRPTTPSRRQLSTINYRKVLSGHKTEKSLKSGFRRSVGRNSMGRVTSAHRGGGNKRLFRDVDFRFDKRDISGRVVSVEYDPNRSAFIGLVVFKDGEKRYMVLPQGVKTGTEVMTSEKAPITPGNRLPLKLIPVGTFVYNIEVRPGSGAKMVRSAGSFAELVAIDGGHAQLKMPSTEIRKVPEMSWASVGSVSNEEHHLKNFGKAGRSRWLGIRPKVRASVMNPVDHPYGGGEGRQGRGTRRPKTAHGKITGGRKTRKPNKYSNFLIVSRRKVGKKKS